MKRTPLDGSVEGFPVGARVSLVNEQLAHVMDGHEKDYSSGVVVGWNGRQSRIDPGLVHVKWGDPVVWDGWEYPDHLKRL